MGKRGPQPKPSYKKTYAEFRKKYSLLAKSVMHWQPAWEYTDYCIELWLESGQVFIYNGTRETVFDSGRRWK